MRTAISLYKHHFSCDYWRLCFLVSLPVFLTACPHSHRPEYKETASLRSAEQAVGISNEQSIRVQEPFKFTPRSKPDETLALESEQTEPIARPIQSVPVISLDEFSAYSVHGSGINDLVVTRDGSKAISGGDDGQVLLHSFPKGFSSAGKTLPLYSRLLVKGKKPILALALSPSERYLLVAQVSRIRVLDLESGSVVAGLTRVKGRISALAWDPREKLVAIGKADGDVFVWDFSAPQQGGWADSVATLEVYRGGSASVVDLLFHPLGRNLFVAQKNGRINLWRLLRTEREMGFHDNNPRWALEKKGEVKEEIASLRMPTTDIWLPKSGNILFAAVGDGNVYSWKVRGVLQREHIWVNPGGALSIDGIDLFTQGSKCRSAAVPLKLLVASDRSQELKFFCRAEGNDSWSQYCHKRPLLAKTEVFPSSVTHVRLGADSTRLWGAQGAGNLLVSDVSKLLALEPFTTYLTCKDAT